MDYGYYPGCSLTGSARKLDKGVKQMLKKLGHSLKEIPDWNCCGAVEYGDRDELVALSEENLKKAESVGKDIIAPCPACYKNLKDADPGKKFNILNPLELLDEQVLKTMEAKRDLKGKVFTPYYGCILLRPEGSAIKNKNVMEDLITFFGGEIEGQKIKDRCCGGNQFLRQQVGHGETFQSDCRKVERNRGGILSIVPYGFEYLLDRHEDHISHGPRTLSYGRE